MWCVSYREYSSGWSPDVILLELRMYKRQPTHLAPEATRFNPQGAQGQDMFLASRYHLCTFCTVPVLETDGCFSKSGCPNTIRNDDLTMNNRNFTVQAERSNHDKTAIEPRENDPGEASLAPLEPPLAPYFPRSPVRWSRMMGETWGNSAQKMARLFGNNAIFTNHDWVNIYHLQNGDDWCRWHCFTHIIWLVVTGTMAFYDFPYIGNVIIPTDELHHFSRWLKHVKTTKQILFLRFVIFFCGYPRGAWNNAGQYLLRPEAAEVPNIGSVGGFLKGGVLQ